MLRESQSDGNGGGVGCTDVLCPHLPELATSARTEANKTQLNRWIYVTAAQQPLWFLIFFFFLSGLSAPDKQRKAAKQK
jgi:hypothetical protein